MWDDRKKRRFAQIMRCDSVFQLLATQSHVIVICKKTLTFENIVRKAKNAGN